MKKISFMKRVFAFIAGIIPVVLFFWLIEDTGGFLNSFSLGADQVFIAILYLGSLNFYLFGIALFGRVNAIFCTIGIFWSVHLMLFGLILILGFMNGLYGIPYFYLLPAFFIGVGIFWLLSSIDYFRKGDRVLWSLNDKKRNFSMYAQGKSD